jgi:cytochrome c peroxidase
LAPPEDVRAEPGMASEANVDGAPPASPPDFEWDLPDYVQAPQLPAGARMTKALVALGEALFHEPRLSLDGKLSCASCHERARAFTVAEATHLGATGLRTPRNAQSLANVAFARYLTWSNLTLVTLEQQALNPLFGDNPVELGAGTISGSPDHYDPLRLRATVGQDPELSQLFAAAYPERPASAAPSWDDAIAALAAFQRSLLSFSAPYDAFLRSEEGALSPAQERGRVLFFSERLACGACHRGPLLSAAFPTDGSRPEREEVFFNNGLYNLAGGPSAYLSGERTRYVAPSIGIGEFTQDAADDGKFRVPSLRNVTVTAPYMHDGSLPTLETVLDHYARGGTLTVDGPHAGDGALHPEKDPRVRGFELTATERDELLAFLGSLTDRSFLIDER